MKPEKEHPQNGRYSKGTPMPSPSRHGGNLREIAARSSRRPGEILDFSANLNPIGPPEWLRAVVNARLHEVVHYPDPAASELVQAIADRFGVAPDEVAVGNGSAELLVFLPLVVEARRALIPVPAYVDYRSSAEAAGLPVETVPLAPDHGFRLDFKQLESRLQKGDLLFLGRPNNPTGLSWNAKALRNVAARWPTATFVVDEAFGDFVEGFETLADGRPHNVVVLRSFTKFYCIPGLRLGCMIADRETVGRMRARLPPWSVNTLAQAVGTEILRDASDYAPKSRSLVATERRWLVNELSSMEGLVTLPAESNFLLVRLERRDLDATELAGRMLRSGVAIRACTGFEGLDARYVRVAVRSRHDNIELCRALRSALGYRVAASPQRGPA